MRKLPIVWQRLVSSGKTCDRCAQTQREIEHAVLTLQEVLRPLDIEPQLEIRELDGETFERDPSASNRIWIADRPIEGWLEGIVGSSRCCSVCGDSECRTIEVSGTTFDAIPEGLILKAALLASTEFLDATAAG